jgi:hypothetical protein
MCARLAALPVARVSSCSAAMPSNGVSIVLESGPIYCERTRSLHGKVCLADFTCKCLLLLCFENELCKGLSIFFINMKAG